MSDNWPGGPTKLSDPPYRSAAVTPNDNADLPDTATRGLFIGGAGTVVAALIQDTASQPYPVAAGTVLPGKWRRVWATGTTASGIIAWY